MSGDWGKEELRKVSDEWVREAKEESKLWQSTI